MVEIMNCETQKKYDERFARIMDVAHLRKPDRVPIDPMFREYWALDYAGYKGVEFKKGLVDAKILYSAMEKAAIDFEPDFCPYAYPRNPLYYKSLGAKTFIQNQAGVLQHPEVSGMLVEEYPEFIENPMKAILEKIVPRLYSELDTPPAYRSLAMVRGMQLSNDIITPMAMEARALADRMGMVMLSGTVIEAPLDFLADFLRGFSNITMDIRRRGKMVEEACEAILPLMLRFVRMTKPSPESWVTVPLHMPVFLREKDFAQYFWPTFKKFVETLVGEGYWLKIFYEGDWTRYLDYLMELPDGNQIGYFEKVDLKQCKEKLGKKMCFTGAFPISLLKVGTPEACIDKARELIDTLGDGGGYIFGSDSGITYAGDAKTENIKAVFDFVKTYGKY